MSVSETDCEIDGKHMLYTYICASRCNVHKFIAVKRGRTFDSGAASR